MNNFIEGITKINSAVNSFVWGPVAIALLMGTGLYLTIRLKGLQFSKFSYVLKNTIGNMFGKTKSVVEDAITPFQAFTTALAATVGTGNIVGVATAIAIGGPGAIFWMWISALIGMATKYAEIVLAVKYRFKNDKGQWSGGPMHYIERGLGSKFKWLAILFACFGFLASFGIGNMTQVNSIAASMKNSFNIDPVITGVVVTILAALVIIGGLERIAKTTEKIVPIMSIFYVVAALIVLAVNVKNIPHAFGLIFSYAFKPTAAIGGFAGSTIALSLQKGMSRGVFSNEAGLGSAPIAHANAYTNHPVKQGLWGVLSVFTDTILICTFTAITILSSGVWNNGMNGADLTISAFSTAIGSFAAPIIAIAIFFFAFSTVLSWSFYGQKCFEYLFGTKSIIIYKVVFICLIIVGAVAKLDLVWAIADTLNGLMAIPNLIGLIGLSGVVVKLTKEYFGNDNNL